MYTYQPQNLFLHYIRDNTRRFAQYPECQRGFVWKLTMQQMLIDTAFRGFPIPPLVVVATRDALLGIIYLLIDGQQRYETFRRYMHDEFATATYWRDPGISPMFPSLRYSELPQAAKSALDSYSLRLDVFYDVPEKEIEMMFRALQRHVPLNLSEMLWSYSSEVKSLCKPLLSHRFWAETYMGTVERKQAYQMLIMAVMIEMYETFCNLTTQRLKDTAAQHNVSRGIDRTVIEQIDLHLSTATSAFAGAQITGMSQFIPVYQAIKLLYEAGCNLSLAEPGILAEWFNTLKLHLLQKRHTYNVDAFARLTKVQDQREFWIEEMPKLRQIPGLIFKDPKRRFSAEQRLGAWVAQKGKCAICGKAIRSQGDAHHIVSHAEGGLTTQDNCLLVHRLCHTENGLAQGHF